MSIIHEALKKAKDYKDADAAAKKNSEKKDASPLSYKPAAEVTTDKNVIAAAKPASSGIRPKEAALLLIALVFVLGAVAVRGLIINKSTSPKSFTAYEKSTMALDKNQEPQGGLPIKEQSKDEYPRDVDGPFKGVVESVTASLIKQAYSNFIVSGIMYLEDGPRAIINNTVVKEGDSVGGATVIRIDKDRVTLKANEAEIVLRVN